MNKIEELKAAYEAMTGDALDEDDPDYLEFNGIEARANFIALAHNLMPALLEAVEALERIYDSKSYTYGYDDSCHLYGVMEIAGAALAKLKGEA